MSEKTKKVEPNAVEPKASELSENDLDQVAGGIAVSDPGIPSTPTKKKPG